MPAPPKMRVVLALLAINPNRVVPADTFVEELWPHDPPVSAADTLYTYIYQLRKLIRRGEAAGEAVAAIGTQSPGYILRVDPENVDAEQYFVTARRGQEALDSGDVESAATLLRSALGLWRGQPLADVATGTFLASYAARLQESRLSTLSQRIAADLSLKRHSEVVSELRALTVEHPFNERFSGQLMIALHGLGRRAEALEVYRSLRATLIRELGLEPSSETSRIQHAILRADAGIELVRTRPDIGLLRAAPAQLPPDIADFTAREEQIARLRALVCAAPPIRRTAPRVALVTGMPGVGKTVLAVHVAHQARARYPDGQLYACLRTRDGAAAPVEDVLAGFLRTVGTEEGRLPDSVDERTRLFRTWCADRRVLVVLDDAVSEAQVQPLLPAGSQCAVVVTSRYRLPALAGTTVELAELPRPKAIELLSRAADQPALSGAAADAIGRFCGDLPLALRAAGMLLAVRSDGRPELLAERLADEEHRLRKLTVAPELDLRTRLAHVHRGLPPEVRRAFPVLGLLDADGFTRARAAKWLRVDEEAAEQTLDKLIDCHLVVVSWAGRPAGPLYRYPELVRLFALEMSEGGACRGTAG